MKTLLGLMLLAQTADISIDLEQEWHRAIGRERPKHMMITLMAEHMDGTPARGTIGCSGGWFKHADEEETSYGPYLPFTTDSRGAIVLNPGWGDYDEEEPLQCEARSGEQRGTVSVVPEDGQRYTIVVR